MIIVIGSLLRVHPQGASSPNNTNYNVRLLHDIITEN